MAGNHRVEPGQQSLGQMSGRWRTRADNRRKQGPNVQIVTKTGEMCAACTKGKHCCTSKSCSCPKCWVSPFE